MFTTLRFVAESPEPLGVTEISRRLALPASTVYRALVTLEETDYIQRYQNTPRFELGMMPHLLNRALLNRFALHSFTRPLLQTLAIQTGHTVSLWCRLGWYALRIGRAFGTEDTDHRARMGEIEALHVGAFPDAILAYLSDDERSAYVQFRERHFPNDTPSPGGWAELEARMAVSRQRGFALESLSRVRSFHVIALPIRDRRDAVIASLVMEGATKEGKAVEPSEAMRGARDVIETALRSEPQRFTSPFAHIAPDDMVIQIHHTTCFTPKTSLLID